MLYRSSRLVIALIILVVFAGIVNDKSQAAPEPPAAQPPHAAGPVPDSTQRLPDGVEHPAIPDPQSVMPDTNLLLGSQIVFQALLDSSWEIFRSEVDGSWTQITYDNDGQIMARLNRGCTKIVLAGITNKTYDIYTLNIDGSGYTQLTYGGGDDIYPTWYPDGSLIAFQTYRNYDQADVYYMSADGSNQTPLAAYPEFYEGQPAWSPDGSQIAFIADYTGDYHIWVMNSDGSNLHEVNTTAYSAMPVWSPDGSQIAYVAAGSYDLWDEIWLVDASGANAQEIYDPGSGMVNAWLGGWSPDGKNLIFSNIYYVSYYGNYYWYDADIFYRDLQGGGTYQLTDTGVGWRPDWQACDTQPPVSQVNALASELPAKFAVSWSGYDNGAAGLKTYDVQVYDDAIGGWSPWLSGTTRTHDEFQGLSGHTYYFRSRAMDSMYNYEAWSEGADASTRVEAYPPDTSVHRLPGLSVNGVGVSWGGSDPGNSGILSYDVQYREAGTDTWSDWLSDFASRSAYFTGAFGKTYYFRARATDYAGNQEAWPSGDGDTSTTLYSMSLTGNVYDNSGAPVSEAQATAYAGIFQGGTSDRNGNYSAYFAIDSTEDNRVIWSKDGYGSLPETNYENHGDFSVNFVLPPTQNLVQNWGFEDYDITPEWLAGGDMPLETGGYNQHTGYSGLEMGLSQERRDTQTISTYTIEIPKPHIASDAQDVLHVVWLDTDGLYYSYRLSNGVWSESERIAASDSIGVFQFIMAQDDTMHLIWDEENGNIHYMRHPSGGDWSSPELLPDTDEMTNGPTMEIQANGVVHVLYRRGSCTVNYTQRDLSGNWLTPEFDIAPNHTCFDTVKMKADNQGNLHILYNSSLYYERNAQGVWSDVLTFCTFNCTKGDFAIDQSGTIHLFWLNDEYDDPQLWHATLEPDGDYLSELIVTGKWYRIYEPRMAVSKAGEVYVTWCEDDDDPMNYIYADANGTWSEPQTVPGINCRTALLEDTHLWLDEHETLHIARSDSGNVQHNYLQENGLWADGTFESVHYNFFSMDLALNSNGEIHYVFAMEYLPKTITYFGSNVMLESGMASVSQVITIPISMTAPTLSFMYDLWGQKTTEGSHFEVTVDDSDSSTTLFSTTEGTDGWMQSSYDLTAWAGETISLTFLADRTAGVFGLTAFLDEVSIGPAYPDIWVAATGDTHARPGDQLTLEVSYGNHGGQLASGTVLSYTLPAGMSFVDASMPPVQSGSTLIWELGDLEARSNGNTIILTLAIDPGAMPGEYQTSLLEINADTDELEIANNTLEVRTYVGNMMMIPALWK